MYDYLVSSILKPYFDLWKQFWLLWVFCKISNQHTLMQLVSYPYITITIDIKHLTYLSLREMKWGSQPSPLTTWQIALDIKGGLQLKYLTSREHCPSFLFPFAITSTSIKIIVGMTRAACHTTRFIIIILRVSLWWGPIRPNASRTTDVPFRLKVHTVITLTVSGYPFVPCPLTQSDFNGTSPRIRTTVGRTTFWPCRRRLPVSTNCWEKKL